MPTIYLPIIYIFIFFWAILYIVFTSMAFLQKSMSSYLTGVFTSLFYFTAVSEGLIFGFHKIPVIGFLVNPFQGTYTFMTMNFKYHWYLFAIALFISLLLGIKLYLLIKKSKIRPLQKVPLPKFETPHD